EFSEPIDATTVSEQSFAVNDQTTGESVAGQRSVDASGRLMFFRPSALWAAGTGHQIVVNSGLQDLAGNPADYFYGSFTTGFAPDIEGPGVLGTDRAGG